MRSLMSTTFYTPLCSPLEGGTKRGVSAKIIKRFNIILFLSLCTGLFAQSAITGKVVDAESGRPLAAVNVQILGTIRGAATDAQGNFRIANIPPGSYSLRASMISYKPYILENIIVKLDRETEVLFELKETPIEFEPVVVLGGKIQQRLDLAPVSLSVVTSKEIRTRNAVNLIDALESAPGVQFIGDQINIRGSTGFTFGAGNKVLLLLDGVPVYASDTGEFNWDMLPPLDIDRSLERCGIDALGSLGPRRCNQRDYQESVTRRQGHVLFLHRQI
jgi:outer membrane receptor for ferrienterochelin and colicins